MYLLVYGLEYRMTSCELREMDFSKLRVHLGRVPGELLGVLLGHLLDVHLRHLVVLLHVLVPRVVELGVLHVVRDLHVLALGDLPRLQRLPLALLLLPAQVLELPMRALGLLVVGLLLALEAVPGKNTCKSGMPSAPGHKN